jgi:hypothetical protein
MQLTGRQREFAGIAGWALPVSVVLGAAFGHFNAPDDGVWGYVQGAVAGILISTTIVLFQFTVFSPTRDALARRVPFLLYLSLRGWPILPRSSWALPPVPGWCGNPRASP